MRTCVFGVVVTALVASGGYCVYFVDSRYESARLGGACISCQDALQGGDEAQVEQVTITLCSGETGCAMPPVTDVFDVATALEQPSPKDLPFISFDEPPFAKPVNAGIVQATFLEAVANEIAPMPREQDDTTPGVERLPAPRVYRAF